MRDSEGRRGLCWSLKATHEVTLEPGSFTSGAMCRNFHRHSLVWARSCGTTRWTTTLSSEVNLPDEIDSRALCGAKLVTLPTKLLGNITFEVHWVVEGRTSNGSAGRHDSLFGLYESLSSASTCDTTQRTSKFCCLEISRVT